MKIGFFKRVIFVLAALLVLAAVVTVVLLTWHIWPFKGIDATIDSVTSLYNINGTPYAILNGVAALYILIIVALFVFAFKKNTGEKAKPIEYIKIGTPENGQIKIATSTVNSMICKNVNEIAGVTDSKAKTNVVDDKTFITIGVSVGDGVIIPKVCEEIQTSTKEKIQQLTGMTIADINILVNNKM